MKIYAKQNFNVERDEYKAGELIADIDTRIPRGNLASLLGRDDMVTEQAPEMPSEPEPEPEPDQESDVVDTDVEVAVSDDGGVVAEAAAEVVVDAGGDGPGDEKSLDELLEAEPAAWFYEQNVETLGELKEWLAISGNRLTDAPTIGKVGAAKLVAQLGL